MLSIIIPTFNRLHDLDKCLSSLNKQFDSKNHEIIVTDDSYKETTGQYIKEHYPVVRYLEGPQKGPAANRNNGAKQAKGDWLIFLDDDCIPDSDILSNYLRLTAEYPTVNVWEGRIYTLGKKEFYYQESPINEKGGYLWSCNFAIKKSLFESIDGFDESFPFAAMEDVDLQYRLQLLSASIRFSPLISVFHPWRVKGNMSSYIKKEFSRAHFWAKFPETKNKIDLKYVCRGLYNNTKAFLSLLFKGSFSKSVESFICDQYFLIRTFLIRFQLIKPKKYS